MWCNFLVWILALVFCELAEGDYSDLDLNRLELITAEPRNIYRHQRYHNPRRSLQDVDDSDSSGLQGPRTPSGEGIPYARPQATGAGKEVKIYKPREDPKLYYKSKEFLQKIDESKQNGKYKTIDIVPPSYDNEMDNSLLPMMSGNKAIGDAIRMRSRSGQEKVPKSHMAHYDRCVKCPAETTLITQPGQDMVRMLSPRLENCKGNPARGAKFFRKYGPEFGRLLRSGSHTVIGKIVTNRGKLLQYCRYRVEVIPWQTPECSAPRSLKMDCSTDFPTTCKFSCANGGHLVGSRKLECLGNDTWSGALPRCKARNSCKLPDNGEIGCKGAYLRPGSSLVPQGSRCTIKCDSGYMPAKYKSAFCRKGRWTRTFKCVKD